MRQSPNRQDRQSAFAATLLMLCMLFLALAPTALAADVRGSARNMGNSHAPMRTGLRIEDGIVTDRDGIIGNGTHGADRAPHRHHTHRSHPTMSKCATAATVLFSDTPPSHTSKATVTGNDTDNGSGSENGMIDDNNARNGIVEQNGDIADDDRDRARSAAEDENATARLILPWIIAIIAILAAVLVILALTPKKRRS